MYFVSCLYDSWAPCTHRHCRQYRKRGLCCLMLKFLLLLRLPCGSPRSLKPGTSGLTSLSIALSMYVYPAVRWSFFLWFHLSEVRRKQKLATIASDHPCRKVSSCRRSGIKMMTMRPNNVTRESLGIPLSVLGIHIVLYIHMVLVNVVRFGRMFGPVV